MVLSKLPISSYQYTIAVDIQMRKDNVENLDLSLEIADLVYQAPLPSLSPHLSLVNSTSYVQRECLLI
jgi:hypothetical protein